MSAASAIPLVAIEGVLVLGGALLFGWWQLRSVKRDQRLWAERRRQEEQARLAAQDPVPPTHAAGPIPDPAAGPAGTSTAATPSERA